MFKATISGKTLKEFKRNLAEFFFELTDNSIEEHINQLPDAPRREEASARRTETFVPPRPATPETPAIQPVAPRASRPEQNPPVAAAPSNDYGVDSRGIPWDERIHSTSQGKNKDGSWRYRRGIEQHQIDAVEKEIYGTSPTQVTPGTPFAAPHLNIPAQPAVAAAPVTPQNSFPPPQPVVPSAHTFQTFKATLVPTLAKLVKDGKLDQPYVQSLCKHYGVDLLWKVNDSQLQEIYNGFVQYGFIEQAPGMQ